LAGKGATFWFTLPILSVAYYSGQMLAFKTPQMGVVGLITVNPLSGSIPSNKRQLLAEIDSILRRGARASDLVLPRMGALDSIEPFHILACADDVGLEVVSKRIADQFAANELLRAAAITPTVDYKRLEMDQTGEFWRPMAGADYRTGEQMEIANRRPGGKPEKKVLLVDDDKDLLMAMNLSLRSYGYKVVVAQDSVSATSIAKKKNRISLCSISGYQGETVLC
jgi:hypothetical protein